jgi:hypothetical protein
MLIRNFEYKDFFIKKSKISLKEMDLITGYYEQQ